MKVKRAGLGPKASLWDVLDGPGGQACCPRCPYTSPNRSKVKRHLKMHLDSPKTWVCQSCLCKFAEGHQLRRHIRVRCHATRRWSIFPKTHQKVKQAVVHDSGGQSPTCLGVAQLSLPASLTQLYTVVGQGNKPAVVHQVIKDKKMARVLVFTHSKKTVHRLALVLGRLGHYVEELSSLVKLKGRKKVLGKLDRGELGVVVCSDVMARGMDLDKLDGVIWYDVPAFNKTFIGQKARAGKKGVAVTLCEENQVKNFLKMVKDAGIEGMEELVVSKENLESWSESYEECMEVVKDQLKEEKEKGAGHDLKEAEKKVENLQKALKKKLKLKMKKLEEMIDKEQEEIGHRRERIKQYAGEHELLVKRLSKI